MSVLIAALIHSVVLLFSSGTACPGTCTIYTSELVLEHDGDSYPKQENVPSDLPKLSGPFVGRDEQVNEIVRYLKSESVHISMVHLPLASPLWQFMWDIRWSKVEFQFVTLI